MPLKISFFNKGIFYNNLKRFWLITFAYSLFLLFFVMGYLNSAIARLNNITDIAVLSNFGADLFNSSRDIMTVFQGFFCLVSGLAVFAYMHFPKNTAMIHSLPLRRETLFVTNYLSGLILVIFPLIFNTAILAVVEGFINFPHQEYVYIWFGVNLSITFLLYTFTVFAGMFTGHMAAQAIFFLIYNFLAFFLENMINLVLDNFFFGFTSSSYRFEAWSPLYYMMKLFSSFSQNDGKVLTVIMYFVAGVIFLVSGYLLYRKRHMEVATDVISFPAVKPIFKYSVAFCSSCLLGRILVSILDLNKMLVPYILVYLFGGLVGYFSAEMLLRKSFRVFRAYKGFVVFGLILVLLLLSVSFDFYGYEKYIPRDEDIELMFVSQYPDSMGLLALSPEDYDPERHRYMLSYDPELTRNPPSKLDDNLIKELRQYPGIVENREAISKVRMIHSYIVNNEALFTQAQENYFNIISSGGNQENLRSYGLYFAYRLKTGRIVERRYNLYFVEKNAEFEKLLRDYLTIPGIMEQYVPLLTKTASDIRSIRIYYARKEGTSDVTVDDISGLLDAYKKDILNQDPVDFMFGEYDAITYDIDISIEMRETGIFSGFNRFSHKRLHSQYKNTLDFLINNKIIDPDHILMQNNKY